MNDLDPDSARRLWASAGPSRTYAARSYIFYERDPGNGVFIVESGLLRIDRSTPSGKVALLDLAIQGAIVGELPAIDGEARSATLSTVTEARVRHVPLNTFRELMRTEPAIQSALLVRLARRLRALSSQFVENSTMDAPGRIAARLIRLVEIQQTLADSHKEPTSPIDLKLPISQEELGQWAGLGREGTVKGLAILRSLDVVETGRMRVRILDHARLAAIAAAL